MDPFEAYMHLNYHNGLDIIQEMVNHDSNLVFDEAQKVFELYLECEAEYGDGET